MEVDLNAWTVVWRNRIEGGSAKLTVLWRNRLEVGLSMGER